MKVIVQTLQLLLLLLISSSIYSQETDFITTKYVKVGYDYTLPNDAIDTFIYIRTNDVAEVSKMLQGRNKVKAFVIQSTVLTSELMDTILSREFCELYIDNFLPLQAFFGTKDDSNISSCSLQKRKGYSE